MASRNTISFTSVDAQPSGVLVLIAGEGGAVTNGLPQDLKSLVERAASVAKFKGKALSSFELLAPAGSALDRVLVVGGKADTGSGEEHWLKLGGSIAAKTKGADVVTIAAGTLAPAEAASIAAGILLRGYEFDRYKTKKKANGDDEEARDAAREFRLSVADADAAKDAFAGIQPVVDGVVLARDLVNEPANVLGPVEYVAEIEKLSQVGVEVEILDEAAMRDLGMHALLGVAQGSPRPPRLAIMRWNGGGDEAPVAFVGKGVVFDTGGISIKPAAGMEDMKGDMGGSAAVVGLMRALAGRKAKANVVGIVGLVENAVDGMAQRPGDIVKAMSGTTIEVLNTDAEGRLVLADALWYCQDRFKPKFMVNLATLTGAIIVALGNHHAGLFSNNDELSERLTQAGKATGEKVWRMPLGPEYDKQIEGKFADIKNIGNGRAAGSITAAQFLQRFVNDVPWAHLDIAGTAMGSPANEYNQSWASGYGVRLLNRLVEDHYETK
ncbi:leucyl aminopeptidase [Mangrovicella endophytica]|uniref:leucyl aminopeptidase n=1 Tax=Mangrovicella endophytica TaxID=2066697 RepID=UPI000C9E870A|nr:leucyl aminopeptidase [Mangrovicella endophytica]